MAVSALKCTALKIRENRLDQKSRSNSARIGGPAGRASETQETSRSCAGQGKVKSFLRRSIDFGLAVGRCMVAGAFADILTCVTAFA